MTLITPPQEESLEACMFKRLILLISAEKVSARRAFVRMFANCWEVWIYSALITPAAIFFRMKWQSNSTCLVLSWHTGFLNILSADWLSTNKVTGCCWWILKSSSKAINRTSSHQQNAIALYSASTLLRTTRDCFFNLSIGLAHPISLVNIIYFSHVAYG